MVKTTRNGVIFVNQPSKIVTDSLGFRLELSIIVQKINGRGQHKTYEQEGRVTTNVSHKITINANLRDDELAEAGCGARTATAANVQARPWKT